MSINRSPTAPVNNPIVFFTGKDDYHYTRSFGKWLDLPYITMKRKDYSSLNTLFDSYADPWENKTAGFGKVPLDGTDGFQFHPSLKTTD